MEFTIEYIKNNSEVLNEYLNRDYIVIICDNCKSPFKRTVGNLKRYISRGTNYAFCGNECRGKYKDTRIDVNCKQCNNIFKRRSNEIRENNNYFCSRNCAAIYNGSKHPKREKSKICKLCPNKIHSYRTYCELCFNKKLLTDWDEVKYGDLKQRYNYQKNSRVRTLARKKYLKSDRPKYCMNCEYNKHIEICHIKAINSFSDDDYISQINELSNLLALCPNCHWEFDNGYLYLEDININ